MKELIWKLGIYKTMILDHMHVERGLSVKERVELPSAFHTVRIGSWCPEIFSSKSVRIEVLLE